VIPYRKDTLLKRICQEENQRSQCFSVMIKTRHVLTLLETVRSVNLKTYGKDRTLTISEDPNSIQDILSDLKEDIRDNWADWTSNRLLRFFLDFDNQVSYWRVAALANHNEVLHKLHLRPFSQFYGFVVTDKQEIEITSAQDVIRNHKNFSSTMTKFLSRFGNLRLKYFYLESTNGKPDKTYRSWDGFLNDVG
jgi:hypothetical protein